jgi:hypothetical protein
MPESVEQFWWLLDFWPGTNMSKNMPVFLVIKRFILQSVAID